jgi:hypothetical protein
MATMKDVRQALWNAYKKLEATSEGVCGKSSEGWCELQYPTYWNCETSEEFSQASGLIVYSYALGTSRTHYFNRGLVDRQVNYYTWEATDFYAKAVEIVNAWAADIDA